MAVIAVVAVMVAVVDVVAVVDMVAVVDIVDIVDILLVPLVVLLWLLLLSLLLTTKTMLTGTLLSLFLSLAVTPELWQHSQAARFHTVSTFVLSLVQSFSLVLKTKKPILDNVLVL
jgi:hypothetical protein